MNVNDFVLADKVFGHPVAKITFHLWECPLRKISYMLQFQYMSEQRLVNEVYDKIQLKPGFISGTSGAGEA